MMKLKLTLTLILSLSLAACSGRGTSPTETPGETDAPSSDSQEQTEAPKLPAPTQKKQKGLLRGKINLPLSSLQRIETTVRTEVEGNGNDGTDGSNGINGGSGSDGTDGADGSSGQDGNSGKDGRDGRDAYGNLSYCGEITRAAIFIGSASVDLGIREVNTCSDDGKSQVVRKYKHRVMPHNLGHDLYFECDDAVKDKKSQLCTDGMISDESFSALSQTMNAMLADAGDSSIDEFVIVTHGAINEAINGNSYLNDLRSQGNRIFPLDDGTLGQLAFASAESALTNGMGHESSSLVVWYLDDFTSIWAGREHHPKRTQKILVHSSKHKIKNMGHRNGSTNAKYSAVPGVFREAFKRRAVYRSGQRRATPEKAQSKTKKDMKASAKNIYRSGISTKNGKQIKRMVKSGATVIGMGLTMTQGIQIDPNVPEMILMNPFFNREKRFKNTSSAVDQYTLTEADWYDQGHYASGLIANRTFVMSQVQQAGIRAMPVVDTSPIIDGLFESEGDWWTRQFAE